MITVAAVGDLHLAADVRGRYRPHLEEVAGSADLLLVAGDLTKCGSAEEGAAVAGELRDLGVPTVTVLGNHDHESDRSAAIAAMLQDAGIDVLECSSTVKEINGVRVGIAGTKGFGGGFAGACGSDFGEPEMKAFVRHTKALSAGLEQALAALDTDVRIALLHYAPIPETLHGERLEIYPFLGSYLLAEAIDRAGADLVLHGHAHAGAEKGMTPGGIQVRNVAIPVINHAFNLYTIDPRVQAGIAAAARSGETLR